jgi:membrane-bound lytic murein transglycosylase F
LGATCSSFPYAEHFERYGKRYLPEIDWLWFPAQAKQESRFSPTAVSSAGARGVMQLLPSTFDEQMKRLRDNCSPWNARCSIKAGIDYDRRMYRVWDNHPQKRWPNEIIPLMLASYNCGAGCVIKAQSRAGGVRNYPDLKHRLPDETIDYVARIRRYYREYRQDVG